MRMTHQPEAPVPESIQRKPHRHIPFAQGGKKLVAIHPFYLSQTGERPNVGIVINDEPVSQIQNKSPAEVVVCRSFRGKSVPKGPAFSIRA